MRCQPYMLKIQSLAFRYHEMPHRVPLCYSNVAIQEQNRYAALMLQIIALTSPYSVYDAWPLKTDRCRHECDTLPPVWLFACPENPNHVQISIHPFDCCLLACPIHFSCPRSIHRPGALHKRLRQVGGLPGHARRLPVVSSLRRPQPIGRVRRSFQICCEL